MCSFSWQVLVQYLGTSPDATVRLGVEGSVMTVADHGSANKSLQRAGWIRSQEELF